MATTRNATSLKLWTVSFLGYMCAIDSLELSYLITGADVPDIDTARQISKSSRKQQFPLRLVKQEVARVISERVNRLRLDVEHLDLCGHV